MEKRRIGLSIDPARQAAAEPAPQAADYAKSTQGMGTLGDLLRQRMEDAQGQGQTPRKGKRR